MSIYSVNSDSKRNLYLAEVEQVASIEVIHESENFDHVDFRYSYSFDNVVWSEWQDTTEALILAISNDVRPFIKICIKIEFHAYHDSKSLEYSFASIEDVKINGDSIEVQSIESVANSDIIERTDTKHLFQPYQNVDNIHTLNEELAKGVSDMFGFDCIYFRTEADSDSKSVTFKTFTLHNTVEQKDLKIVINNNELPSNRWQFSEFDVEFLDEMEVHIVKEEFTDIFGEGLEPNSKDYLYLHLTNRMYKINTVFDDKNFMNKSTYFSAMLVKYEDGASVNTEAVDDVLTDFVDPVEEFESVTQAIEFTDAEKTFDTDNTDVDINAEVTRSDAELIKDGNTVFKDAYDLDAVVSNADALAYDFVSDDEHATSFWMIPKDITNEQKVLTVYNSDAAEYIELFLQNDGFYRLESTSKTRTVSIVAEGTAIAIDALYGIVVNYIYNARGIFLTISVLDTNYDTVQETSTSTFDKLLPTSKLAFSGGKFEIANVRIRKTFVSKEQMATVLTDKLPSAGDYYAIDNNVPEISGEKFKAF